MTSIDRKPEDAAPEWSREWLRQRSATQWSTSFGLDEHTRFDLKWPFEDVPYKVEVVCEENFLAANDARHMLLTLAIHGVTTHEGLSALLSDQVGTTTHLAHPVDLAAPSGQGRLPHAE